MSILDIIATSVACMFLGQPAVSCVQTATAPPVVAGIQSVAPERVGQSLDVELTAEAALVWDVATGEVLYEKNQHTHRPVASLNKLLSALVVRSTLDLDQPVEIPLAARRAGLQGANVGLQTGEHVTGRNLLSAGMIASANDAMVALAVATSGSESQFVREANQFAPTLGANNTIVANATGLSGGEQHSTAHDIRLLLHEAYRDPIIGPLLSQSGGTLSTLEGARRSYKSTNDLLKTYVPISAAKTGYTRAAGENLAIITTGDDGQQIGTVVLGSTQRFQDTKVLVEWIWRNYTWK